MERDEHAVSGPQKAVKRRVRVSIVSSDGTLEAYAHREGAIREAGEGHVEPGTSKRGKGSRSRCVHTLGKEREAASHKHQAGY
jgi:hypothetical protein